MSDQDDEAPSMFLAVRRHVLNREQSRCFLFYPLLTLECYVETEGDQNRSEELDKLTRMIVDPSRDLAKIEDLQHIIKGATPAEPTVLRVVFKKLKGHRVSSDYLEEQEPCLQNLICDMIRFILGLVKRHAANLAALKEERQQAKDQAQDLKQQLTVLLAEREGINIILNTCMTPANNVREKHTEWT